jgi:peptide/nickel transport system ATP-binding protein
MSQGKIMEQGPVEKVLTHPDHPYTKVLMASVPHLRVGWLEEAIDERDCVVSSAENLVLVDSDAS